MAAVSDRRRDRQREPAIERPACTLRTLFAALASIAAAATSPPAAAQLPDCTPVLATVVSIEGTVEVRRGPQPWTAAAQNTVMCGGDSIRVSQHGRAALRLVNETTIRLDQDTTLVLAPPDTRRATWLEQFSGRLHVMTRTPRAFGIKTPFVNANVDGTEFSVFVGNDSATVSVLEGTVIAANDAGSTSLAGGEQATTQRGGAPSRDLVIRSADAVAWTLHFPAVFDDSPAAAAADADAPGRRAARLLQVGRLDEARPLIDEALRRDPADSAALALDAVVALVGNRRPAALAAARRAVAADPRSPGALVALSYALQADFQLDAARRSLVGAVRVAPGSALAHARLAELELSLGDLDAALDAARRSVAIDAGLGRTQTVLGYANLARFDTRAARAAFERAITIDQSDPLPRLGLGLARIRDGDLAGGREAIEVAAILDPGSSLLRSYLGKAYHEEGRDGPATTQLGLAAERDPRDPTPHLYGAMVAQATNRPVRALNELERSIALNDNRAVYRSRLFLDQDLAARGVRLARVYRELGFDQLARLEAVKSLNLDPTDASAHRFLADSYLGQIRTDAARVSELLQAQLRQPLGLNALQPDLLSDTRSVAEGIGPVRSGGHEYTPLFARNQVTATIDGIAGGAGTLGEQVYVSGLRDALAWSVGQYHFRTDGLRVNDDVKRDIANAFVHWAVTPSLRLQAELRHEDTRQGDLSSPFDPALVYTSLRDDLRLTTARLGAVYVVDPRSDWVFSAVAGTGRNRVHWTDDPSFHLDRQRVHSMETQYTRFGDGLSVVGGVSMYRDRTRIGDETGASATGTTNEATAYGIVTFTALPHGLAPQLGLSWSHVGGDGPNRSRLDPKLGLVWSLPDGTTLRAAAFSTLKRSFVANQTLQPVQFAGFTQFYDDTTGTLSRRLGIGIDQRLSSRGFVGAEASTRRLEIPVIPALPDFRWRESEQRLYAYRILGEHVAATVEWRRERHCRDESLTGREGFSELSTHFVPLGLNLHWGGGWSAKTTATWVRQRVRREDLARDLFDGSDRFVVVDAGLSWRRAGSRSSLAIEAKNLFDRQFRYQEIVFYSSPRVSSRRLVLARATLAF